MIHTIVKFRFLKINAVMQLLGKVLWLLLQVVMVITNDNNEFITSGRRPRVINSLLHE